MDHDGRADVRAADTCSPTPWTWSISVQVTTAPGDAVQSHPSDDVTAGPSFMTSHVIRRQRQRLGF